VNEAVAVVPGRRPLEHLARHGSATKRGHLAAIALALLVSSCDRPERSPAERGAGVFARACAGCHGPTGRGARPPGFTTPPRDLTDPELQARLSDDLIRETIRYGKGQMPPFGKALPPEDLTHVIAFVRTLARPLPESVASPSSAPSPLGSPSTGPRDQPASTTSAASNTSK